MSGAELVAINQVMEKELDIEALKLLGIQAIPSKAMRGILEDARNPCVPLVCHFFASEDRVHALRAPELQGILDAVLFEPGRYLDTGLAARPPSHARCACGYTAFSSAPSSGACSR